MNIKIYDFNEIEKSGKNYGGVSGFKLGIKLEEKNWILKFPKSTKNMNNVAISYTTTPLSEYIGSHIYESTGIPVHETILGIKDEKVVVACKDFIEKGEILEEFRETKNEYIKELEDKIDSLSVSGIPTDINMEVINIVMNNNTIFIENPSLKEHFWDMFVIDTLIGNNDRNNGNWGIIKDSDSNSFLRIAPVYDNGAAFYNKKSDVEMQDLLNNSNKFQNSVINSMRCPFSENGKEINPKKYIESFKNEDLNQAILRVVSKINLDKIKKIIDEIPNEDDKTKIKITSDIQKEFYYKVLEARYKQILLPSYKKLLQESKINNFLHNTKDFLNKNLNFKLSEESLEKEYIKYVKQCIDKAVNDLTNEDKQDLIKYFKENDKINTESLLEENNPDITLKNIIFHLTKNKLKLNDIIKENKQSLNEEEM